MLVFNKPYRSWTCKFHGESGTEYFAILTEYDPNKSSICNIVYFNNQDIGQLVFCAKYDEKPSSKLLYTAMKAFLGYDFEVDCLNTPIGIIPAGNLFK